MIFIRNITLTASFLLFMVISTSASVNDASLFWGKTVKYVRVESNVETPSDFILQAISIKEGDILTRDSVRTCLKRLNLLNRFSHVDVSATPMLDGCAIIIDLKVNYLIDRVIFEGGAISVLFSYGLSGGFSPKTLLRSTGLKQGSVYSDEAGVTAVEALKDFYYRNGYGQCQVKLKTKRKPEKGAVDLIFEVNQGKVTKIRKIDFSGNEQFSDRELLMKSNLFTGKQFKARDISNAREKLVRFYKKKGFLSINVYRPDIKYHPEDNYVDVFIEVSEEHPVELDLITKWHTWNIMWWLYFTENRQDLFLDVLGIGDSRIINRKRLETGLENLQRKYMNQGYINAVVELEEREQSTGLKSYNYVVNENEKVKVRNVEILETPETLTDTRDLAQLLGLASGSVYHHDTFDADRNDLVDLYLNNGYRDVEVEQKLVHLDSNLIDISYEIQPGNQYRWSKVEISGNSIFSLDEIQQLLKVQENGAFNPETLDSNLNTLLEKYLTLGYAEISIDKQINNSQSATPSLKVEIHEGVKSQIDAVLITGYSKTQRRVIERNLPSLIERPFNFNTLMEAERKLSHTNLFRSVDISGLRAESGLENRTVMIRLKEQPFVFLEGGPGYNTDRGFNGYLSLYTTNLGGSNRYLGASGSLSQEDSKANLIYREPEFMNLPIQLELRILSEDSEDDGYRLLRKGGRATWSYRATKHLRLLGVYRFDDDEPYDIQDGADLPDEYENPVKIASLSPVILYDSRDDPRDPHQGSLFSFQIEFARPVYSSEVNFTKTTAEATHFFKLPGRGVFGASLRLGLGYNLPYQEQFRLGGIKTIRGWDFEEIRVEENEKNSLIIGEETSSEDFMVLGNFEFRHPFFWGLEGVIFLDSGNVFNDRSTFSFSDLKTTLGVGLRFMTPVGPVGLDYGYNIMKDENDSRDRWSFIIGHTF